MTLQEIQELAGHREVSPWIVKLVGDAIAREREECVKAVSNALYGQVGCGKAIEAIRARGRSEALTNLNKAAEDMGQEL